MQRWRCICFSTLACEGRAHRPYRVGFGEADIAMRPCPMRIGSQSPANICVGQSYAVYLECQTTLCRSEQACSGNKT